MSTKWKVILGVFAALVVIGMIGSLFESDEDEPKVSDDTTTSKAEKKDEPTEAAEKDEPAPSPKYDGEAFAKKVQAEMRANLGGSIKDRCDLSDMRWHCFFDHYESPQEGRVDVHLSFPGDFDSDEIKGFSEQARLHTFNLAGITIEELDQIVSFGDGRDTGTTNRRDVPLLN